MSLKRIEISPDDFCPRRVFENLSSNQKRVLVVSAVAAIVLGLLALALLAMTQTRALQELLHRYAIILSPSQVASITLATAIGGGVTIALGSAVIILFALFRREDPSLLVRRAIEQAPLGVKVAPLPVGEESSGMRELLSLSTPPRERTLCDREAGWTCFINVALQTMAHLHFFRRLFDPSHHLLQRVNETEEKFQCRQRMQILGNQLLSQILSGSQPLATGLDHFLEAVEEALPADWYHSERSVSERLQNGSSSKTLQDDCTIILCPKELERPHYIYIRVFPKPGKSKRWVEEFPSVDAYPALFYYYNNKYDPKCGCANPPPVDFYPPDESVYYRLEVIAYSNTNHITAFLRDGDKFVEMDDLHPSKPYREVDVKDIPTWLAQNPWEHVYYSKVSR